MKKEMIFPSNITEFHRNEKKKEEMNRAETQEFAPKKKKKKHFKQQSETKKIRSESFTKLNEPSKTMHTWYNK